MFVQSYWFESPIIHHHGGLWVITMNGSVKASPSIMLHRMEVQGPLDTVALQALVTLPLTVPFRIAWDSHWWMLDTALHSNVPTVYLNEAIIMRLLQL